MKIRPFLIGSGVAAMGLMAFFLWRGGTAKTAVAQAPAPSRPEQGLRDDLHARPDAERLEAIGDGQQAGHRPAGGTGAGHVAKLSAGRGL